ncbi:MAG: TonB-dependent receptor, partial [Opitutae bacterium]|nr:TonB-dependent receptor [Opitutae bacterium]
MPYHPHKRTATGYAVAVGLLLVFGDAAAQMAAAPPTSPSTLKKLSLEELMDLEVTSVSRRPEKLLNAASAIQVVTNEDIRRSGASSIPEALRLASNLQVAQASAAGWKIGARGFNASVGNKLLALIDGRSVYTPLLSGVIWNTQDYLLEDIERIEVISGPGGTLWGANAVNGVISITTKNAGDTQGLYLEAGAGSELRSFTGIRYGGTLAPNVHYRVYGKYFDRDGAAFTNGHEAADSWDRTQAGFRIDAETSPRQRLTLQGDLYTGDTHTPSDDRGRAAGGNILGRWTRAFADDTEITLQIYYDRTHLAVPFPSSGSIPAGVLKDDLDTFDFDLQHGFRWGGRHHFVWGLGYRFTHDKVENAPTVAFTPGTLDQNLFSGFVQDEILLRKTLSLSLGTKLEHFAYTGFEAEPGARLQWNLTGEQMVWGAVSRAVRTPARYDRDQSLPNPLYGVLLGPNTTFHSETVVAYELGWRGQLGPKVSGSLSAFYNVYDDLRGLDITPVTFLPLIFQNTLEAETYGAELSAHFQASGWWRLHLGYNLLREHVRIKPGRVDLFNALNETADPGHQLSLRSSLDLTHGLELDAALRWVDTLHNNDGPAAGRVPGYAELDVRLGWRPLA